MEPKLFNHNPIQDQSFQRPQMGLHQVFARKDNLYLNELNLFLAHFNAIPNFINEININCSKANKWFIEKYKTQINDMHYMKRYYNGSKTAVFDDVFYLLYDDLMVDFDTNNSTVRFLFRKTDTAKIDPIISGIHKFRERRDKPKISLLCANKTGIDTKSLQVTKPRLNIEDNYNDDFKEIHRAILKRLSKNNDKGLVLLHGKPGTGKTTYIRYLIATLKKNIIFLPPSMATAITNPDFISVLIDNPNSIFVIEDAEYLIADRERYGGSPVSALLNVSDGLLSDCLNIQIICSFNTDLSKVDNALLRKGRLIAKYEFKELQTDKARRLSQKLGYDTNIDHPMSLSEIYNQGELDFQKAKIHPTIGFKTIIPN